MPIEIIVALSNLKTVGRGLKKNLGDAKGTLPSPFFYYGYSSFQFVLPFVILPLKSSQYDYHNFFYFRYSAKCNLRKK